MRHEAVSLRLLGDLVEALVADLSMGEDEEFSVSDRTLNLVTTRLGATTRAPVFLVDHTPRPHDRAGAHGLGILFTEIARHRIERELGGRTPRHEAMHMSRATRALALGLDVQAVVDEAWLGAVDAGTGGRISALWRTRGRNPSSRALNRETQADVIDVDTPDDLPWMSGSILAGRFEICTVASRDGRVIVRLSEDRPLLRVVGMPEIAMAAVVGRPLHQMVDHAAMKTLDVTIGNVVRSSRSTATLSLQGSDLIRWTDPGEALIRDLAADLERRATTAIEVAARIAAARPQ
jgi:hypothetical protein